MALSEERARYYSSRLLLSRTRILCRHPFYGVLLMHLKYRLDESCPTAYTDAEAIAFSPEFLDSLSDDEVDTVMMHEILHVVLMHCIRGTDRDPMQYNIAADIVVNSNILKSNDMNFRSITLSKYGELMHEAPNRREGFCYTAEEVYDMLSKPNGMYSIKGSSDRGGGKGSGKGKDGSGNNGNGAKGSSAGSIPGQFDDHSRWGKMSEEKAAELRDTWTKRLKDAAETVRVLDPSNSRGTIPIGAKRIVDELSRCKTDWRTVLNEFVQIELNDYSFSPPDRRFDGYDFFLPDLNVPDERVENLLFFIDTSGSMSDKMISEAYSEITGAIEQFGGKLSGSLGFFDAVAYEPTPFSAVDDVLKIRPRGGGGTSFSPIFDYVSQNCLEDPPASIIILTDGYAPFPDESESHGIPVLWIINNEEVTPPWGKIARIS